MLNIIFTSSILIISVIILRYFFLDKLPKQTFPLLWGVILLRLLIPFSFESPIAFLSPFSIETSTTQTEFYETSTFLIDNPEDLLERRLEILNSYSNLGQETNRHITFFQIMWGVGFATIAFIIIKAELNNTSMFKNSVIHPSLTVKSIINRFPIKRKIKVLQDKSITTPVTYGIINPKIVLPENLDVEDINQLEYILNHEFYHIKRFDALWKMLGVLAICLYWFNPLVWVALILANRDLEISCDDWVVKNHAVSKKAYAQTLIRVAENTHFKLTLTSGFSKYSIEERLISVMKAKKSKPMQIISSMFIIIAFTFTAFVTSEAATNFYGSRPNINALTVHHYNNKSVLIGDLFDVTDLLTLYQRTTIKNTYSFTETDIVDTMIQVLYESFSFNADGHIINLIPSEITENNFSYIGMFLSKTYDPTIKQPIYGYVPSNSQILFMVTVCATTNEVLSIAHSHQIKG